MLTLELSICGDAAQYLFLHPALIQGRDDAVKRVSEVLAGLRPC